MESSSKEQAYAASTILLWIFVLITLAIAIAGLVVATLNNRHNVVATTADGTTAFRTGNQLYIVSGDHVSRQDITQPQQPAIQQPLHTSATQASPPPQQNVSQIPISTPKVDKPIQNQRKSKNKSVEPSMIMVQLDDLS